MIRLACMTSMVQIGRRAYHSGMKNPANLPRAIAVSLPLFVAAFLLVAAPALADQAVGYGRATTGGRGGPLCHVRDEATLRACVSGANRAVIAVDVPLTINPGKQPITVGSNKTIDGGGKLSLIHDWIGLDLNGAHNVIIRNIQFRGSGADVFPQKHSNCAHPSRPADVEGCGVSISMTGATTNVWIDHDAFDACGNKCIDAWGRAQPVGVVAVPDLITISDSTFRDSYFAILFGVAAQVPVDQLPVQPGRATLYGNLFERIMRRSPRAASGYRSHVFNNVFKDFGGRASCRAIGFGFGPSATDGGQILLENNVIESWPDPGACKQANNIEPAGKGAAAGRGDGLIRSTGNLVRNGATAEGGDRVFVPDYEFSPFPADQVQNYVRNHAGVQAGG
jgi:pectate lyase